MCAEAKPPKFSKPGSQYDRAIVRMSSGDISGIVQCNLESSTASCCSPLIMGVDSQESCAASHAFGSTSL